jgi:hypothetical protein
MAFADRLRGKDKVPFHESGIWHQLAVLQE